MLSATVNEAGADAEVEISYEEAAQAAACSEGLELSQTFDACGCGGILNASVLEARWAPPETRDAVRAPREPPWPPAISVLPPKHGPRSHPGSSDASLEEDYPDYQKVM